MRSGRQPGQQVGIYFHPLSLVRGRLPYDDFALVLPEDDFLADPVGFLDALVDAPVDALSPSELERRSEGTKLMQRIMATDTADSLFAPALAKEIVAVMNEQSSEAVL